MSLFDITGKVAIVTGASKGIGQAIAQEFAKRGAKVTVSSRKMEGVSEVAREIGEAGGEAMAIQAHMGYQDQVDALVNQTIEKWGRIDIAINNAATNPHFGPLLTAEDSQLDKIFDVNLKGYFRLCKTVYPHMQGQKSGKIINLSSVAGIQPGFNMGVYSISKAGVIMLTKSLARELGPDNIQVNAIAPGVIKTKFSQALWESEALMSEFELRTPLKRIGLPDDVVGASLYLASAASDWVTGTVMVIDGGALVAPGI
jgi:NAD(P)-dependent dehydrogenase (short-subunit alcohol dehydrogenase family)